ncbi:MAG: FAD-binding oxidoreductase [Acidimicrobiales bacterium]
MTPDDFLHAARTIVGGRHVLTDPDRTAGYTVDWTRRFVGDASSCVLRPGSLDEVVALVAAARRHLVALVPQGGNTGLVGGGVPLAGEAVVSLRRLDRIEPVDRLAGQVTAGAGATLAAVQAEARRSGWELGVDLAARDTATIGGMVATNAGGLHVLRYGAMRAQVTGVEAVLGTGAVVARMAGLVKDNTGYDLAQLLCGSEGTLGIVTRVRLRLVPPPGELVVGLLGLPSTKAAVALAADLRSTLAGLRALEVMAGDSLRRVADHVGVPPPVAPGAAAFLLVEVAGPVDPTDALADAVAVGGVLDAAVATARPDRERLWRFREAHPEVAAELASRVGLVVHKLDVTLPVAELAGFCDEVASLVEQAWPQAVTLLYGHVGDGNIHVNVVAPDDDDGIDDLVLGLVVERGGSISAEHGIGTAKKQWLLRDRSAAEVEAMRAVKRALDPDGILNPNVLLP